MNDVALTNVSIDSEVFVARTEYNSMYTTSKDIAEKFNKQHKHVLASIKDLVAKNSAAKSMFVETTYENRGKKYPMYFITRDGFSLLVMGFTGQDAIDWKVKYMAAFNRMEQIIRNELNQLKKNSLPARGSKEFLALALVDAQQIIEEQERQIQAAQPAIAFHNAVSVSESTILMRDLSKFVKQALNEAGYTKVSVGEKKLYEWMRDNGYIIKGNNSSRNTPTQKSIDLGVMVIKETTIQGSGKPILRKSARITGKGQQYFIDKFLEIYKNGGSI